MTKCPGLSGYPARRKKPPARQRTKEAEEPVRNYYEALNRGDADAAIIMWSDPDEGRLRPLISRIDWFQIDQIRLKSMNNDQAEVWVQVKGKNVGEEPRRWVGTIRLILQSDHWKIVSLKSVKSQ